MMTIGFDSEKCSKRHDRALEGQLIRIMAGWKDKGGRPENRAVQNEYKVHNMRYPS